jgi:hypothetical protein
MFRRNVLLLSSGRKIGLTQNSGTDIQRQTDRLKALSQRRVETGRLEYPGALTLALWGGIMAPNQPTSLIAGNVSNYQLLKKSCNLTTNSYQRCISQSHLMMAIWAEVMNRCVDVAEERISCLDMRVTSHSTSLAAGNDSSRCSGNVSCGIEPYMEKTSH